MKKIILSTLIASSLFATTYTLEPGWNLLGTISEMPVSQILANSEVKNVVIYKNGGYESSASNGFTTIPEKSGFFVYTDSSTIVDIATAPPSSELQHLDGDLNPTEEATWAILKVVDANLLVEMKTSTYNAGLIYNHSDAVAYCENLTVGSVVGWRLPEISELKGLSEIYKAGNENDFIIKKDEPSEIFYWSNTESGSTSYWNTRMIDGETYGTSEGALKYSMCVKTP